jgi:hypothetical protein
MVEGHPVGYPAAAIVPGNGETVEPELSRLPRRRGRAHG